MAGDSRIGRPRQRQLHPASGQRLRLPGDLIFEAHVEPSQSRLRQRYAHLPRTELDWRRFRLDRDGKLFGLRRRGLNLNLVVDNRPTVRHVEHQLLERLILHKILNALCRLELLRRHRQLGFDLGRDFARPNRALRREDRVGRERPVAEQLPAVVAGRERRVARDRRGGQAA